jgi:hypothetical protein
VAPVETLLAGGDFLVDLDYQRADGWRRCCAACRYPCYPTASLAARFGDTEVARSRRAVIEWPIS